jgi:hypothetical protein
MALRWLTVLSSAHTAWGGTRIAAQPSTSEPGDLVCGLPISIALRNNNVAQRGFVVTPDRIYYLRAEADRGTTLRYRVLATLLEACRGVLRVDALPASLLCIVPIERESFHRRLF